MRRTIMAFAVFVLAGCSSLSNNSVESSLVYGCSAAAVALQTAVVFFDDLTPEQRNTINEARLRIDPVCLQEGPLTLEGTVRVAFDTALQDLVRVTTGLGTDE